MAQSSKCFLPRFASAVDGPKCPASMKTRLSATQHAQLLTAWKEGRLETLMQATWALVLHYYIRSEDICFGYQHFEGDSSSNSVQRSNGDISTIRISINDNDSLMAIVDKVRVRTTDSKRLSAPSEASEAYLSFNTSVMLHTYDSPASPSTTLLATDLPDQVGFHEASWNGIFNIENAQCQVRLHVKVMHDDIQIFLEWRNGDMSGDQMKSVANIFEQLLAKITSTENPAISQLNLFSENDWQRIRQWNATLPHLYDRCIHEAIHDQMVSGPNREAICAWDGSLTFAELDHQASKLACHLRMQGVGPEVRVGLCFEKSKWNTVAMLGIMKAGGAFSPLDPSHPISRLQGLVKSVQASLVLCSEKYAEKLRPIAKTLIPLCDETLNSLSDPADGVDLASGVTSQNAAYVLFTSGSTGEPKGTLLEHRAFLSSAMVHGPALHISRESRSLNFAAYTFDASLAEVLTPLIHGACVCVPSEEARLNDMVTTINEMRVTQASFTPSYIGFIEIESVPGLDSLVLAGEAMSQSQLATWSKIKLVNGYGPTEASVACVLNSHVTPDTDCKNIGLPVGVRAWLVNPDNHDQLVPVGCPGELLLEGPSLARCYVNNPQKTNESFIYDPAWTQVDPDNTINRRFYKTGDLVRYNADTGSLNYIGRKDTQVKVHGQRIELGEIENQLSIDSRVTHCSVFFPKSGFSKGRLVAVLSSAGLLAEQADSDLEPLRLLSASKKAELVPGVRERLSARLPTYMVPSVWLSVEALPLLPSGKLDRKGIATWVAGMEVDPDLQNPDSMLAIDPEASQPANEREEILAAVYSRVLNIPQNQLNLNEGFLNLGGDSIAAMTCTGLCKKRGLALSVQELLRSKSIRDLATRAKAIDHLITYEEAVDKPFNLSPIQVLHFGVRKEGQGHFNQGIVTHLNEPIAEKALRTAIESLITQHSMLRARFTDTGSSTASSQHITNDVQGSYRWRLHSVDSMEEVKAHIAKSQASINCFSGPLLAVDYFGLKDQKHVLSMTAHHLVVDIVSWRIILEDLEEFILNPEKSAGNDGSLPFQTWCRLQQEHCDAMRAEHKVSTEKIPAPDFGYWGLQSHETTYGDVDCASFDIDATHTNAILLECHKALGTEPIDIFLAAMLHSFGRSFPDRALPTIFNEGHGREPWDSSIDISHTVGWFTIVHPIALAAYNSENPIDTLIQVKDLRRKVSDNGRTDFTSRVFSTEGRQGPDHPYPFEMSFNYVGQHRDLQRTDGLFQLVDAMAGEAGQGGGAADFGRDTPRFGLFEISAMVVAGKIRFNFSFNKFMDHQNRIHQWVSNCQALLVSLSEQLPALSPRFTLSSFPMLSLTYPTLDKILLEKLPTIGIQSDLVEDIYPCSRMQQGILLSRKRDSSYYAVHDTFEVRATGASEPNLDRLVIAWQQVVSHHAMFRTIFVEHLTPRHPFCQVVLKRYEAAPVILHSTDEDVLACFDKQQPKDYNDMTPAYCFTICQTSTGKLFARIEMSHAGMDGNSISIILRDLQLAYAGRLEENSRPLFKNYMQYLQDAPGDASLNYWCSYLDGARPCLFPILTDGQQCKKALRSIPVQFKALSQLQTVCEKRGLTLANVFNAAWGLTLRAFCGSDDVSFSYMASLRDVPVDGMQWVVGPAINLLVCRMKLSDDSKLGDILHQVQNDYLDSLPHRHTSLIDIQHALKMSDRNLFDSGVSYRRLSASKDAVSSEIECVEVGSIHDPAEFPVFINIEAGDSGASIDLNYWTTTLSDAQALNVANTYLRCLDNIVSNMDGELRQLESISEENRAQIMNWNNKFPSSFEKCAHQVVQEMAKKRPESLAIAAWDGNLTYAKLDQYSSRLASYLVTFGVGRGTLIPVCFDKSIWNVVSILAIMKTGGGCIPIDTPQSMTLVEKWIVDNTVQVALASPEKAQLLEDTVPYVIPVSESLLEYLSDVTIKPVARPSDIAYIAMTSGTLGPANTVVLDHSTIMTRAEAFATTMAIADVSRTLQFATHTSDSFLLETFGTFLWGGCLCIPADIDPMHLAASINVLHANVACITPTAASFFSPKNVPGLRSLALSGEIVPRSVLDHWQTDDLQLQVLYGTSETSSGCFHAFCSEEQNQTALIGKSPSCASWVVDPSNHDRLVPIGSVGELAIEGPVLARGYLYNQGAEAINFFQNPAWMPKHRGEVNRRVFKTGDLVRYHSNGSLTFVGRKHAGMSSDIACELFQTQECVDASLESRNKCIVESIQLESDKRNTPSLVAFLVSSDSISATFGERVIQSPCPELKVTIANLHSQLSTSLPGNKVPSIYIPIASIPLTLPGKLNRHTLRAETQQLSSTAIEALNIKSWNGFKARNRVSRHASLSEASIAFWKQYLADVEPCLFPALGDGGSETTRVVSTLKKQTANIHAFSRLSGLPIESMFQFAWALVLRWYTGSDDVCFGYSSSGSKENKLDAPGIAACRFIIQNDLKLLEILQGSKKQSENSALNVAALDAVKHQLGLGDITLFNTSLSYRAASSLPTGTTREPNASSVYEISVEAEVSHSIAEIHFNYSSGALSSSQAKFVIDVFDHVLDDLISQNLRDRTVGDIDMLSQQSVRQIRDWNAASPPRVKKCADELIQQQALLHPRAEAICSWDKNFTYGQLEIVSSRLARYLSGLGVKPEVFVVLCFEKSAWAVVAQLAVLKAGGAFVSIDPSHPDSRLKMLIDEIGADLVLCSSSAHANVSKLCAKALAVCQTSLSQLPDSPLALAGVRPTPSNAAYAIFTSGTTGKPKATVVEHTALSTTALAMIDAVHMDSGTRALQFSNYTFDVSILEIMMTLMTGGCVCVPSEEERMNNLGGAIRRMEANYMASPPAIVNTLEPKSVPTLKTIITGGEKMPSNHIDRWHDRFVINAYGPSEATVIATVGVKVDWEGNRINDDPTSIGTAANCRVWIVDPNNSNRLLPVGAVGEMILEGSSIAREYLGNEEKSRAVFFKNPTWNRHPGLQGVFKSQDRMYRTGDLVRYNSDGTLEFISRKDTQIKFNGVRIELEEIEHQCLRCLPGDSQVAVDVVVPEERTIAKSLAAFFTVYDPESKGGSSDQFAPTIPGADPLLLPISVSNMDAIQKLKGSLPDLLPQSMMPRLFFPIRNLPFTSSAKIDRRRLKAMVQSLSKETLKSYSTFNTSDQRQSSSATGLELQIVSLVESTLGLETGSVTADDSFFALGGDSLSAMNLVGVAQAEGLALTVSSIFKSPLLIDMAKSCEESSGTVEVKQANVKPFSLVSPGVHLDGLIDEVMENCELSKDMITDIYPCSAVQEGLLTLSIKHNGAYVAQPSFRLADGIDLARFKQAWQQTVADLEILRTRIVHTEAMNFAQVVLKEAAISWVQAQSFEELPTNFHHLPKQNGAPLTGFAIVQAHGSSSPYFVWSVHHALYDGWSIPLIFRKVEENYSSSHTKSAGTPYSLFINYLVKRDLSESDAYWKSYLAGTSSSQFPVNKNALPDALRAGNTQHHTLKISRAPGSVDFTLPVLIRAAWAIVLATHTSSGDVCFGETLSGRNIDLPGVADIAGPVLTTVPTRLQVANDMRTLDYLKTIHESTTEMIPHLHHGLQRIRQLSKDTSSGCEFKNLLVIQPKDGELNNNIWVDEERQAASEDFFTHPLVVECGITKTNISFTVHHDELVINGWQTKRITEQFAHVLSQLIAMPKKSTSKIGDLDLVSPEDKTEIATWNQRTPLVVERCVQDFIQDKSNETPNAQAVCAWDGDLTYREFWNLASGFANYLTSRGVGPEVFVPVCLDKSAWAMVTLISILIAGGGYVPLDPSHPTSRHEEILADVGANMILCTPNYTNRYSRAVKTVIPISKETIKAYGSLNALPRASAKVQASNMAYALFTSGSTGRAKGIIVEHRNVVSSIMAFAPWVRMDETSRVFQFASLTFDAAVMETLAILMLGGTICVPSEDDRLNDVSGAIRRLNVTWTFLTPSIASIIEPSSVPSLKHLVCGGEKMSKEVITKWANTVHLMNGYGPTETCVFAVVDNAVATNRDPARIGYGIPSTLTWIVDPENHDRLTPLGAVGELALEGAALAREYLKNPEKNAEAFAFDPAWIKDFDAAVPGPRRIYKTGDLCYYNPDGSIEYIGRKDHQVKLHGQRMELGEIEHRLMENSRTRHAVVILPKQGPLKQRLVTVMSLNSVAADNKLISDKPCELVGDDELERHAYNELIDVQKSLEDQLPIYMVPQTWALIKKLPMLVSGKLDRKKITAWLEDIDDDSYDRIMADYDRIKRGKTEEKPQEKDEKDDALKALREVISQVLNISVQKVNVDRSFVSLGGDSITGMAIISRARKQDLVVTLHDILQSRSIKELAQAARAKAPVSHREEKSGEGFALSPIQKLYFQNSTSYRGEARFNQSMTVRISRRCEGEVLRRAIKAVMGQHAMLRARFIPANGGAWQQKTAAVRIAQNTQLTLSNPDSQEVDESFRFRVHSVSDTRAMVPKIADSQTSLDPVNGPILAADLFNLRTGGQVLFLVAHHLCIDMVSWRIVLQDLEELVVSGSLSLDKALSFQSWCALQTEQAKLHNANITLPFTPLKPNLQYWGMQNSPNVYGDIKMESFTLAEDTTNFILDGCHSVFCTDTVDILLAALIHSFGRTFTDRKVPTIYNEGHGRESWDASIDLSRTVGWFTTMAPLQIDPEACESTFPWSINTNLTKKDALNDIIKRVKDTRRQIPGNGRPFFAKSLLQDQAAGFPVPLEVLFNYLGKMQQLERADSLFHHHGSVFDSSDFAVAGDMGPQTSRFALFEVSAIVIKERLNVAFTYNRNTQHESSVRRWILRCKQTLEKDLLNLKTATPEPTLSDYPLLPTNYHGLQMLTTNTFRKAGIRNKDQVEDIYPCSPMQEGLLLSQLRDPNAYMFHTMFEVKDAEFGKVNAEKLARAWEILVDRHPVFRTIFVDSNYTGGSFDQLVLRTLTENILRVECLDSQVEEKLAAISLRDLNAVRQAKLSHQLTICKTNTGRVLLKLEINHAIIDGGSVDVVLRDLALAYERKIPEGPGPRFSEYIKFIRTQSQGEALEHWKQYLSGVRPCHLAPSAGYDSKRELKGVMMNFQRYPDLLKFCEQSSVTLANLTLSAWAIVLRQFTGSDDVCFGYLSAGRDAPVDGIQDMVGIFINMLCCRVKFAAHHTLAMISKNVQDDYIQCIPHQSCSLASIQHELGWQGQSLFNTTLSIQNHSVAGGSKDKGLTFDLQHAHDPSEYAVTVNVEIARGQEGILLRYWNDVVSDDQAQALVDTVARVFTSFIDSSTATLSQSKFDSPITPDSMSWDYSQTTLSGNATSTKSVKSAGEGMDNIAIQKFIDDRVHQIIGQMMREGRLTVPPIQTDGLSGYGHTDATADSPYQLGSRGADDSGVCSATSRSSEDGFSAEVERKLWTLWSTALGLSPDVVRHQDSFFKLGGDSITAMKMVSAAREEGLVLTVADVFNNPVFEDMLGAVLAANVTQQMLDVDLQTSHKDVEADYPSNSLHANLLPNPSSESIETTRLSCVDDAAVASGICPKIGVFKGGIADVLPVTDFQAMSLTATLHKSRWMLNYFYLEGNGPLDLRRLRESCLKVVDAFDILRTVFVCFQDQFFQVVLRKIRPSIFVYETDRALDEFTMTLQQRDREYGPREGEQYVQFYVVKKKGSDQHRILVRLSHTQYDGVCLPKIMAAIKSGYEGTPMAPVTPFAGYLRQLPGIITPDHYHHWSDLLKGSQMTQIVRRKGTSMFQNVGAFKEIQRKIDIPPNALGNVTIATVMQAAWALALAKISAQPDVVFGLTISGRNAPVPGIENTVGPCVNVIPVRVKLGENWTGVDLFRYLQDQQVSNMPFESLGFREIIKQCTDWPSWTYFTTSVFHQNVDYQGTLELDTTKYRMGGVGVNDNLADLTMVSRPEGETGLSVTLGYSERGPVMPSFAQRVLDMACEIAQSLIATPSMPLPSASMLRSLPPQTIDDVPRPSDEHFLSAHLKTRSIAELLVHSDILSRSWHQVLPSRNTTLPNEVQSHQAAFQLNSSFFDLGGDVFNLAQLTWLLEQEGLKVRVEDLIEHPSFLGQMAVLALHNPKHLDEMPTEHLATGAVMPDAAPRIEKKNTWDKARTLARKLTRRNNTLISNRA